MDSNEDRDGETDVPEGQVVENMQELGRGVDHPWWPSLGWDVSCGCDEWMP